MLPKKNRLKKKKDFERVLRGGKVVKGEFLVLKVIQGRLGYPRFGIIVSLKVSKKAVERNKIKRRIRHALREFLSQIKKTIDGVFIAQTPIKEKDFSEIKKEIEKILQKSNLIS